MGSRRRRRYELNSPELNQQLEQLLAEAQAVYGESSSPELIRQIMVTALQLVRDGSLPGDVKLMNSAFKEMRHAMRVFTPYANVRKVSVFGSARTAEGHPEWEAARLFAEKIVEQGWMVITGAGDGIMGAAQGGAGRAQSFGVNIRLPFEQSANDVIEGDHKLINFRYFFTRKVTFVKESHAVALFPGGFGTHDEGFETLTLIQTGKSEIIPIVFVDAPGGSYWKDWQQYVRSHLAARGLIDEHDTSLFKVTDSIDVAMHEILSFYSNYHSGRWVRDLLVMRLHQAPDPDQLEILNTQFKDLLVSGRIEVAEPLSEEEGEVDHLSRLTLRFKRRGMGRLRQLIDRLNDLVADDTSPAGEAAPHEILETTLPPGAEEEELED